ncbi:MAG TPA: GNAT family N-acetyltransferase [Polyangiaceae bacterium]|nr:GNAT family N-acetyltransferase [Polyangiaceae bacterium]
MTLTTKILAQGDEAVLERVADDVFDDPIDLPAMAEFLADPRHHIAVAIDDGLVVGFASGVHYVHPDKKRPELFVNEVGVADSHQGRGIGKAVLGALLEQGRALGCAVAWVLTDRDNVPAMRLYTSTGGTEPGHDHVMFSFELDTRPR